MLDIGRRLVRGEQSVRVSGHFTRDPNAASGLGSPLFYRSHGETRHEPIDEEVVDHRDW
jgi:hypothetical protein